MWLNTDSEYDVAGNVTKRIDARNNETTYNYADHFGVANGDAHPHTPPTELGTQHSYAFPTSSTNALSQTAHTQYDFYLGVAVDSEDINGVVSSIYYTNAQLQTDPLDRPLRMIAATGTSAQSQSSFSYNDTARMITVTSDRETYDDNAFKTETLYDKLGRLTETRIYESATAYITNKKEYDALGRIKREYNPYRTTSDPTYGWTEMDYDALGRVTALKKTESLTPVTYSQIVSLYDNNKVTVTDQKPRSRQTVTNALGRLTQVIEDPGGLDYQTSYTYDVLGNLRKVQQGATAQGPQYRYFMYDSLSRLIRAKNPEQQANSSLALVDPLTNQSAWTAGYTYDANGKLETRTDARNITATFAYDALERNTSVTYPSNANTPDVINTYDNPALAYGKGRLWKSETTGDAGTLVTVNGYDAFGRPLSRSQQFKTSGQWSVAYTTERSYKHTGSISSQTYPSGHVANYAYDVSGRLNSFMGNLGDGVSRSYASGITYDEGGRMLEEQYGTQTALYHKLRYNIRGQLYDIRLSTLSRAVSSTDWDRGCLALYYSNLNQAWGQSGTDNNGNVTKAEVYVPNADGSSNMLQDRYAYDDLNRLLSVNEYQWGTQSIFTQIYDYDRYGNRTINQSSTTNINRQLFSVNAANNQLGVPAGQTGQMSYDPEGNLTTDTYSRADLLRTYDAENRLTTNTNTSNQVSRYTYDAAGHRVRRNINNQEMWQIYGMDGELIAEYAAGAAPGAAQKEYGYRGGQLLVVATSTADVQWLVPDHLGTPRLISDKTGTLGGVKRHDYLPFGEEISAGTGGRTTAQGYVGDGVRQKFTGYERDDEINLDYAQAKYYSSIQGRFTGVDAAGPDLNNPQTLNKYRYSLNNPLRYVDKDGLYEDDVHRNLTIALAMAAGFNMQMATSIGRADNGIDYNKKTDPYGVHPGKRKKHHFASEEEIRGKRAMTEAYINFTGGAKIDSDIMKITVDQIGDYLHALQDSFSHKGYGSLIGHVLAGHLPDKTHLRPELANRMAETTYDALVALATQMAAKNKGMEFHQPIPWECIASFVDEFNKAKSEKDKGLAVNKILQAVFEWRIMQAKALGCLGGEQPRWWQAMGLS